MNLRNDLIYVHLAVYLFMSEITLAYKTGCSGGYCFIVSDYSKGTDYLSQSSAVQWCLVNNSQLVEIVNSDIQYSLVNVIQNSFPDIAGVYTYFTNGKRETPVIWFRLNGANIGNISVNGATDASYAYGYLTWTNSGFDIFASRPADTKEGYICYGVSSDCTNGVIINGQCYKAYTGSNNAISWYDARDNCLNAGGDLASFDYITTNAGFNALNASWMGLNTQYRYWIGFGREYWAWQGSKKDVKYSDWLNGHPTNTYDCLCLTTRQSPWQWAECDCNQLSPFVCLSANQSSISITSPNTSLPTFSSASGPKDNSPTKITLLSVFGSSTSSTSHTTISGSNATSATRTLFIDNTGLSGGAKIGIGVGIGVGGFLIIVAVVVVVVVIMRKSLAKTEIASTRFQNATGSANRKVESSTDSRGPSSAVAFAERHYEALDRTTPQQDHDYQHIQHSVNPDYNNVLYVP